MTDPLTREEREAMNRKIAGRWLTPEGEALR